LHPTLPRTDPESTCLHCCQRKAQRLLGLGHYRSLLATQTLFHRTMQRMLGSSTMEHWEKTYTSDVDIYEAFGAAFDPEGIVWHHVLETVPFAGKAVLEIGCGLGHYAQAIAPQTESYIALDVSESMLAKTRQRGAGIANLTFLQADAQEIPLPDHAVDLVFGTWAIGAIGPPEAKERAIGEIHRVIKPGGEIWAVETHWASEFMDLRGPDEQASDHQTFLWYQSHGFDLIEVIYAPFIFPSLAEAQRVLGFMFEEKALSYLEHHPSPRLEHGAIIVRKQVAAG
jgi:ubiquinone/menaquinone biosynthesis C-methylase UbiE